MEDAKTWEPRLNRMFDAVEGWEARIEQAPTVPVPGSSLADEDRTFPVMPVSQVAYNGLVSAVEHLDYFRSSFQTTGRLYPAANYTVIRSALMGSAQAVWVLGPPTSEARIGHALEIAIDSYNQERKRVGAATELTAEQQGVAEKLIGTLDARLDAAAAVAAGMGKDTANIRKWKLDMTRVIAEAVALVFLDDNPDAELLRSGAGMLWRSQSGHAHGTPGSRLSLINRDDIVSDGGAHWGAATSSFEQVATAFTAATLITNEAWRLYDQQCQPAGRSD